MYLNVTDSRIMKGAGSTIWLCSPLLILGNVKYKTKEKCSALKCSANTFGLNLFNNHYHLFVFPLYSAVNFPYLRGGNSSWISSLISENQCSVVLTFSFNICPPSCFESACLCYWQLWCYVNVSSDIIFCVKSLGSSHNLVGRTEQLCCFYVLFTVRLSVR